MADPRKQPKTLATSFVEELKGAAGDRLQAATLFGSAARGEWIEGVSDVNVMVLLDTLDAPLLATGGARRAPRAGRRRGAAGHGDGRVAPRRGRVHHRAG
jgi:predicted nucleotidyltransferase